MQHDMELQGNPLGYPSGRSSGSVQRLSASGVPATMGLGLGAGSGFSPVVEEMLELRRRLEIYFAVTSVVNALLGLGDLLVVLLCTTMIMVNANYSAGLDYNKNHKGFKPGLFFAIAFGSAAVTSFSNSAFCLYMLAKSIVSSKKEFSQTDVPWFVRISYGMWVWSLILTLAGMVLGIFIMFPDYSQAEQNPGPENNKGTAGGIIIAVGVLYGIILSCLSGR